MEMTVSNLVSTLLCVNKNGVSKEEVLSSHVCSWRETTLWKDGHIFLQCAEIRSCKHWMPQRSQLLASAWVPLCFPSRGVLPDVGAGLGREFSRGEAAFLLPEHLAFLGCLPVSARTSGSGAHHYLRPPQSRARQGDRTSHSH